MHLDHPGSTNASSGATQGTGAVYFPFGSARAGNPPTDYTYTGQKVDTSDGLMYYGSRYYDAQLGCFINADTIVPGAGNPQSLNRYAYTLNNPVKYVDPSGNCPLSVEDQCEREGGHLITRERESKSEGRGIDVDITNVTDPRQAYWIIMNAMGCYATSGCAIGRGANGGGLGNQISSRSGSVEILSFSFLIGSLNKYGTFGFDILLFDNGIVTYSWSGQSPDDNWVTPQITPVSLAKGIAYGVFKPEDYLGPFYTVGGSFGLPDGLGYIGVGGGYFRSPDNTVWGVFYGPSIGFAGPIPGEGHMTTPTWVIQDKLYIDPLAMPLVKWELYYKPSPILP